MTAPRHSSRKTESQAVRWRSATGRRRSGVTLVEVTLAAVLLALLALGGSAFLFHSRATVLEQGRKRQAYEIANGRMEEMRAIPRDTFTNLVQGVVGTRGLYRDGNGNWTVGAPTWESIVRDGFDYQLQTEISRTGGVLTDLRVTASYAVSAARRQQDAMTLQSRYLPNIDFFP